MLKIFPLFVARKIFRVITKQYKCNDLIHLKFQKTPCFPTQFPHNYCKSHDMPFLTPMHKWHIYKSISTSIYREFSSSNTDEHFLMFFFLGKLIHCRDTWRVPHTLCEKRWGYPLPSSSWETHMHICTNIHHVSAHVIRGRQWSSRLWDEAWGGGWVR